MACADLPAADQPQWGTAWTRNQISTETGLPGNFDPLSGKHVAWRVPLGTQTHSTPVIAGGRVYIGTNNGNPRDPRHQGDRGILMCLDEQDGHLLWQLVVPKRTEDRYQDWPDTGMSSPATVEGDRVYTVTNRGEVVCLDAKGMANGNDGPFQEEGAHQTPADSPRIPAGPLDADILWILDMKESAGIWPHDGAHSSILIHGSCLYLNTGNGVDHTHRFIRTPDAPGLLVIDKSTGRILTRDHEKTAPTTFHATWSSPSLAEFQGQNHLFFAGGNGILYNFDPLPANRTADSSPALRKRWSFDPDPEAPKTEVHRYTSNRQEGPSTLYAMPVFHGGRLFVAAGGDLWWGKNESFLLCLELNPNSPEAPPKLLWKTPLGAHVLSTPAVTPELIWIADTQGTVFCLDRTTGRPRWTSEMKGEFWGSPLVADGKVYVATRRGDFRIFSESPEKQELFQIDLRSPVSATPTAANQSVYLATMKELWCLRVPSPVPGPVPPAPPATPR